MRVLRATQSSRLRLYMSSAVTPAMVMPENVVEWWGEDLLGIGVGCTPTQTDASRQARPMRQKSWTIANSACTFLDSMCDLIH